MKHILLALLLLSGTVITSAFPAFAQDTLFNFDDIEFTDGQDTDGQDTAAQEYLNVPDDIEFTDGQDAAVAPGDDAASNNNPTTLWGIFIAGIIGGFAAFLMPCIYPMVPLTVSFFTKQSGTRAKGVANALLYGLFIIVIYVALGMLVTLVFGASALNEAASSAWFNLLFFIIIVVFAVSFLGAFEITLPSRLVNKMDEKSNRGGLLGLFFMAFTLALVSFSCTGPIIGYLLVEAVSKGALMGPAMGMLGFSVALAIPFMLFAFFPSLLKEMPSSGGWLNTVKVSLGFLELALAFKFLSNVDLAYHWGILDREVFLAIWIVIFGLFGLYLLGKLKFAHDSDVSFISIPRLFFAIAVLSFTVYMVPGMWGAPLKALSAWLPPSPTQDFNLHQASIAGATPPESAGIVKKYGDVFHAPHGIDAFYDYEQALAYSKQVNKPVLLDFTGWSCVNCRKMEESVWPDPTVLKLLKEDYILASLYVDDRTALELDEQYVSSFSGKKIRRVGQKWSDLQQSRFGVNAQPYYVIVDGEGNQLVPAQAYNEDIQNYVRFLESGLSAFHAKTSAH
ncbi:protein-disulfide reductase DsbD family protein [Parapedobacter deserti]|uniref:Protein-disulfide reductase DsbD family protein n=1 Tax=Parapedobacter deserti TaxID=1912957 RepID=A0ABV7JKD0_9SPHI